MGGFQIVFPDNNINTLIFWLVVWNIWIIFPYIANVIIPTVAHSIIFQRGGELNHQPMDLGGFRGPAEAAVPRPFRHCLVLQRKSTTGLVQSRAPKRDRSW